MMEGVAEEKLEREHVHQVYSQIAPHFSDTRYKPWPRVAQFLRSLPEGSLVADIGCGNGKYLGVNESLLVIGSDICSELVGIARSRGHEVAVTDCLRLPYRTGVCDAVICIAVIHHLASEQRRLQALTELVRIVRPGGSILVYVWAFEQTRKKFSQQDVMVDWHLQPKYQGMRCVRDDGESRRGLVGDSACQQHHGVTTSTHAVAHSGHQSSPDRLAELGYRTYQRYYHVFRGGELSNLFTKHITNICVRDEYYDHDNWCVIVDRTQ